MKEQRRRRRQPIPCHMGFFSFLITDAPCCGALSNITQPYLSCALKSACPCRDCSPARTKPTGVHREPLRDMSKPNISFLEQEDWSEEGPSLLLEKLNESKVEEDKTSLFGMMVGLRHIDEVLADCIGSDASKIQIASDALRDVLRSDPNFVFAHMSRILSSMIAAVNNPKGLPLPDNPRVKSNIWGAMQLATIVKDGSMVRCWYRIPVITLSTDHAGPAVGRRNVLLCRVAAARRYQQDRNWRARRAHRPCDLLPAIAVFNSILAPHFGTTSEIVTLADGRLSSRRDLPSSKQPSPSACSCCCARTTVSG
jgi:hypothetical protein